MTPEERAREIAYSRHTTDEAYADLILSALREARNAALEEAAKVSEVYPAERTHGWPGLDHDEVCHAVGADITARIRALKDNKGGEE
jgi:hypothetical protein